MRFLLFFWAIAYVISCFVDKAHCDQYSDGWAFTTPMLDGYCLLDGAAIPAELFGPTGEHQ